MKTILKPIFFFTFILNFISCQKFIEIPPPPNQLVSQNVFTSDASAIAAMVGTYSQMMSSEGLASGSVLSITQLAGLSADELTNYNTDPNVTQFYRNNLTPVNSVVYNNLWKESYTYIYSCNAVLEGLASSTSISDSTKKELTGEAKFLRAFCHFYLVNLFGDVPLITTTDYRANSTVSRTIRLSVYQQIISDLQDAETLLRSNFDNSNNERVRPTSWAATALLARVFLYQGNWAEAVSKATTVINHSTLFNLENDLNNVFLKNSMEAIWQLMPVIPGYNTNEGNIFILTEPPTYVALTPSLVNSFETGDFRKSSWLDSIQANGSTYYYPFKYKIKAASEISEYSMVFRLAEQYLIRAEARARQNNIGDAQADLNKIRTRAGLDETVASDQPSLINAILKERRVELFSEWGHRWLDLKRYQLADQVLGPEKESSWQATDTLYPIPQNDIINNPNLIQNAGY